MGGDENFSPVPRLATGGVPAIKEVVQPSPSSPSKVGTWLKVGVSGGVLALVLWTVDWSAFTTLAATVRWPAVLLAALCMGLAYPLHAWRLGVLLRQQGIVVPFTELHRITWISIFFGSLTPGGVGGDASRLLHVFGRVPDNKPGGAAAVIVDRVIGLAVLLLLAVLAAVVSLRAGRAATELTALLPVFLLAFLALIAGWWLLARLPAEGRFAALRAAARQTLRPPGALGWAALISLTIWSVDFAAGWVLARALGWPVGLVEISLALAVAYTVSSIPLSLGGHGVREGVVVVVLGWFGFSAGAPVFAVAFLALTLGWSLVGGGVWLLSPTQGSATTVKP